VLLGAGLRPRPRGQPSAGGAPQPASTPSIGASFDEIYEAYFDFVWRSLRRLGVPLPLLDDATQEVFFVVHRRLADFERRSSLKTWLFGIAINVSQHAIRAAARRSPSRIPHVAEEHAPTPQEHAMRAEAVRLLYRVLDDLDTERRTAFVMAELEQMSAPEIAEATGWELNTVYSRLRLARRDFEAALKRHRAKDEWRAR
jgi:RNA polymerase sigma-70 factor (ECF subfamily)